MEDLKIRTPREFAKEIENLVTTLNITHLEACMHYGEQNNLDMESVGTFIRQVPSLKSKIYDQAEELKLVKPSEDVKIV